MRKRAKNSIHGNKQYTWKHLIPAQNIKIHKIKKIKDCTVCVKKRMLNSFVCSVPMFIFLFLYALKNKIRKDFNPPPHFFLLHFFSLFQSFLFFLPLFGYFLAPPHFCFVTCSFLYIHLDSFSLSPHLILFHFFFFLFQVIE